MVMRSGIGRPAATALFVAAGLLLPLRHAAAITPGSIAALIAEAREVGNERTAGEASSKFIQRGIVALSHEPAAVTEALDVLDSHAEQDAVLVGVLRGLALLNEHPNPVIESRIHSSFCSYRLDPNQRLSAEADESIRLRCRRVPSICICP